MSTLKRFIRREIRARQETLVGTVVSDQRLIVFDGSVTGSQTWVVNVDIGSNRILRDVPVKAGERGRFYAQRGQTVLLRRNTNGRIDVIAPADRVAAVANVKRYDLNAGTQTSSTLRGFDVIEQPFEYYMGPHALKGNPSITFARVNLANDTITRAAGSFLADGFQAGDSVRIGGETVLNAGVFTVAVVSASVLEFAGDVLQSEGPLTGVRIGVVGSSRWGDGVTPFPYRQVIDLSTGLPV